MRGGWFPVPRDCFVPESPAFPDGAHRGEACEKWTWLDLGGLARFEPGNGLARGELRVSQGYLAKRWGWSKPQVRRYLERLEAEGCIERRSGAGRTPSIIRIVKYDELFVIRKAGPEPDGYGASTASAGGGARPTNRTANRQEEKKERRNRRTPAPAAGGPVPVVVGRKKRRVAELQEALASGRPHTLLHCVGTSVKGITVEDCAELLDLLGRAEEEGVSTEQMEAPALFAEVLYDLGRKRNRRFTRNAFIGFVAAAMRAREYSPGDTDDAQSAWAHVCEQGGWGGEEDTQGGGLT